MRWLGIFAFVAACSSITSAPGDDDGSDGGSGSGSGSGSASKAACEGARDCTPEDSGCASFPYESLPPRCVGICYEGRCCDFYENAWHLVIYDCTRPAYDGGIDAP